MDTQEYKYSLSIDVNLTICDPRLDVCKHFQAQSVNTIQYRSQWYKNWSCTFIMCQGVLNTNQP